MAQAERDKGLFGDHLRRILVLLGSPILTCATRSAKSYAATAVRPTRASTGCEAQASWPASPPPTSTYAPGSTLSTLTSAFREPDPGPLP